MSSTRSYTAGETIFREGEPGDWAAVIDSGTVEITTLRDGQPFLIGTRGADSLIGEMAVIDGAERSATITARDAVTLSIITRTEWNTRVQSADPIVRLFSLTLLQRLRDTLARLRIENPAAMATTTDFTLDGGISDGGALAAARDKIRLAGSLKSALANNEISLYYQPVVHVHTGDILGFEALMRWHLPGGGEISPGTFIPLAEESDLICALTQYALHESFKAVKALNKARPGSVILPWFMGVNLSGRDLGQPDFVARLTQHARDLAVNPALIKLEITESMMIANPAKVRSALLLAQAEGFQTALDDFGTGYSSLSYLQSFPINYLKIDRSFVQQFLVEEKSRALVLAIINLAKSLGMTTLAEGIEQAEESSILAELGCDLAQGFYYARPMPLENALKTAANWIAKPAHK